MKRGIALILFFCCAFLAVIIAWALQMPGELIIPFGAVWGAWVMPFVGERLVDWSRSSIDGEEIGK